MRNLVLVGTAVTRPNALGALYTSQDGGAWKAAEEIPADASVQAITPHPTRPNLVFVATRKGIYRSEDAGTSWHRLEVTNAARAFWSVVVSPHDPDVLFAGTAPVGFFRSRDGGKSWTECEGHPNERFQMSFGGSRAMRIAFHPTDPNIMYAVAEVNGLFVSEDAGKSWHSETRGIDLLAAQPHLKNTELTNDDTEGMFDGHAVVTTPAKPEAFFYVCRMGLFESDDRGKTLRDLEVKRFAPFSYSRECRFVAGEPRKMYACFSISSRSEKGALYGSDDLGATWHSVCEGLDVRSTVMGFGAHVTDPNGVVFVTRHGQVFTTTDACRTWSETQLPKDAGDAFCAAIL